MHLANHHRNPTPDTCHREVDSSRLTFDRLFGQMENRFLYHNRIKAQHLCEIGLAKRFVIYLLMCLGTRSSMAKVLYSSRSLLVAKIDLGALPRTKDHYDSRFMIL
jgi:hypothetical protein